MEILELVVALSAVARRAPAGAAGAALLKGAEGIFHFMLSTTFYDRQIIITTFGCIMSMSMSMSMTINLNLVTVFLFIYSTNTPIAVKVPAFPQTQSYY